MEVPELIARGKRLRVAAPFHYMGLKTHCSKHKSPPAPLSSRSPQALFPNAHKGHASMSSEPVEAGFHFASAAVFGSTVRRTQFIATLKFCPWNLTAIASFVNVRNCSRPSPSWRALPTDRLVSKQWVPHLDISALERLIMRPQASQFAVRNFLQGSFQRDFTLFLLLGEFP